MNDTVDEKCEDNIYILDRESLENREILFQPLIAKQCYNVARVKILFLIFYFHSETVYNKPTFSIYLD